MITGEDMVEVTAAAAGRVDATAERVHDCGRLGMQANPPSIGLAVPQWMRHPIRRRGRTR